MKLVKFITEYVIAQRGHVAQVGVLYLHLHASRESWHGHHAHKLVLTVTQIIPKRVPLIDSFKRPTAADLSIVSNDSNGGRSATGS